MKAEEMHAECCSPHLEKAGKCVDPDHIVSYCAGLDHNVPIIIHCSFHRELHPQHVGRVERLQRNLHRAPPGAPKCVRVRWFTRYI